MITCQFGLILQPCAAATIVWDAGSGADFLWDTTTNWSTDSLPTSADDLSFPNPQPNPGSLVADPSIITLGTGELANSLSFFAKYTLNGGSIAMTSGNGGNVFVTIGNTATINSLLTGSAGLTKENDGALILTNIANDYTGSTIINAGIIIVTDQRALGADTSAVQVTGNTTRGSGGGALVVGSPNNNLDGTIFSRDLALTGGGLTGDGNAFNTVGSNTFTGNIVTGGTVAGLSPVSGASITASGTRLSSTFGTTTLNGGLTIGPLGQTTEFTGNGNWVINSNIDGDGSFSKTGNGLVVLNGSNTFAGTITVSSGYLRLSSAANLGANTGNGQLTISAGKVEFRQDIPNFTTANKVTFGTSTTTNNLYLDHSIHGSGINQTVTLGLLTLSSSTSNRLIAINSRNGYGITFTGNMAAASQAGITMTNNGNGLLTYSGNFWNTTRTTASTLTINGAGDTLITGNILASGAAHVLTKAGAGTLTINSTGSTFTGATNIQAGTLAINDFRALNNAVGSGAINIGSTTTTASLSVVGNNLAGINLTTSKVINLSGTSGGAVILANQTGSSPALVLNADFTATGAGSKALTLGGENLLSNTINGAIVDNGGANQTSVVKTGDGQWVLAGTNTYTGATLVSNGILSIQDTFSGSSRNVISDSALVGLGFTFAAVTDGSAGGVFQYLGAAGAASSEKLGTLLPGGGAGTVNVIAGSAGGTAALTFASLDAAPAVTTTAAITGSTTTFTVASTAGLVPGMKVTGGVGTATTIVSITNGTQFVVSASQTNLPSGTVLNFSRANGGATVNFNPDSNSSVIIGSVPAVGMLNSYSYFKGADFAYAPSTTNALLRAPVYDGVTDGANFVTAGSTLSSAKNNRVTASTNSGAMTVLSLKIDATNSPILTQTGLLTIRTGAAGTSGGILVSGGTATIGGTGGVTTGGAADLIIRVDGALDVLNLNTPVTSSTTGGLTKTGAGTLVIGALNAYTTGGSTNLLEGTIQLAAGGRLSANSVNLNMRQGTTLNLNGISTAQSSTTSSIGAFNGTGTITNTSPDPVLFAVGSGTTGGTGTFNGTINEVNGQISVIKMGTSNTQVWTGISNYTGSTTIGVAGTSTTGSLSVTYLADIGSDSSIGRGDKTSTASNRASLVISGISTTQVYSSLNYTGSDSVSTDRLFTIAGTAANSGARILANGANNATLIWSNPNELGFGTADMNYGLTLGGASLGDNQFNPLITDNGAGVVSLTKTDAGLWILGNSANSYTGATTITSGALRADGATLPASSPLVINGGVFQSSDTAAVPAFTRSLTDTPTAGAGTVTWTGNGGFAASTDKLTVNIGGHVSPDQLQWGTGGFVSGTLILSSTTSLAEVEMLNGIDLNGANRTIQVDTNATTNSDLATLSGVISNSTGIGGIVKTGSGTLHLLNDNTYNGDTTINGGTVRAVNIGNSTSSASNFGTGAGKISIGTSTTGATLAYVGNGETTDREIDLAGTIANTIIESSGTGPLILTNVVNTSTGTSGKTLSLQGDLNAANEITSALTDNSAGGALAVTKDDSGTWILSGQSTYTGTTTISAGAFGLGADSIGAVGSVTSSPVGVTRLTISNGSVFALNGDRTLNTLVRLNANASSNFIGINSITLNSIETLTGGNTTVTNMLPVGKFLTLNSPTFTGAEVTGTNRAFVFNGSGDTILNASVTDSAGGGLIALTYNGTGSLTLGGSNGGSTYTSATTITSGTLKLGVDDALPFGTGKSAVTMNPGTGLTATLDLNGYSQTINGLTASSTGTAIIDNSAASPVTFTFGANDQAVTLIGGITNSGGGALSIVKTGAAVATMTQGPFSYTGSTTVNGGSLTISSDVSGTTALNVTAGSFLGFTGGLSASSGITSINIGAGGELKLFNNLGEPLDHLTSLTLGAGSILDLNTGTTSDSLTLLAGHVASVSGVVTLNVHDTGSMVGGSTYDLLIAPGGGLTTGSGDFVLNQIPGGFTSLTLNKSDTLVSLTTGTLITSSLYWTGATDSVWNTVNGTFDGLNWSSDKSGTPVSSFVPGAGTTVVFQANSAAGGALVTTMEQGFRINNLVFEPSTSTPSSIAINPGADVTNLLIIEPMSSTDGINLKTGSPALVSISAPLRIGADQTWTVADSGSTLSVSGALSGSGALTTDGPGTIIIATAAAGTFAVPTVTINNGTLNTQDIGALGTTIAGNAAAITINSGAAFYYTGPTNTSTTAVNNALTLAGGTLSAGGSTSNHYYTGAVSVTANSFINLRDSNSASPTSTVTNIILGAPITGTGRLSVDSSTTLSGGNQLSGILYLQGDNNGWSGGISLTRGTVQVQHVNGIGTGAINASLGRMIFSTAGGTSFNLNQNITVDAAAGIFELSADAAGTPIADMTVNLSGIITIGSSTNANNALRISQSSDNFSVFNISNSIVLGNNASISYQGSSVRPLTIDAVISDGGSGYSLAINDELGGWGVTSQTVHLTALNTFSGSVSLTEGTLQFDTVTDAGGAASSLGQGSAIILGSGTLSFVGSVSQSTNRPITQTGASIYGANGTGGATITYSGGINAAANSVTLVGTGAGIFSGGITLTGGSADINGNSGTWTFSGTPSSLTDDFINTGASVVINLNSTGVITWGALPSTSPNFYLRSGATANLGADNAVTFLSTATLILGDVSGTAAQNTLNMNGFNLTVPILNLGGTNAAYQGLITGPGTLSVGTTIVLNSGSISANLTGGGAIQKFGQGTVTLSGNNGGLTNGTAVRLDSGVLLLDYSASNTDKLRAATGLDMRGGSLTLNGNSGAATLQQVASLSLASGGSSSITLIPGGSQDVALSLGAITRATSAGTIRFELPSGVQSATNGVLTTTTNNGVTGLLGTGVGYATVTDGTGTYFATNSTNASGGNIVPVAVTAQDAVTAWLGGQNISDSSGFTGTLDFDTTVNTLRFNASGASKVTVSDGGVLTVTSGGILQTSNVTGGSSTITGGTLQSSIGSELIFITDSPSQSFIVGSNFTGATAITKSGAGTLVLSGNSNYATDATGIVKLYDGTLQVAGGYSIGDTATLTIAATKNAVFELLSNETIGTLATGGVNQAGGLQSEIRLNNNTLVFNQEAAGTYSGVITGAGTLIKSGSAAWTYSQASPDFSGTFQIDSGLTVFNGNVNQLSLISSVILNGPTSSLRLDNDQTTAVGSRISDTAVVTLNNTAGTTAGSLGLFLRRTAGTTTGTEAIGQLVLNAGNNTIAVDGIAATRIATINFTGSTPLVQNNFATLLVVGRALGDTAVTQRGNITFATNPGGSVGGTGATATTFSIFPYVVGESTAGAPDGSVNFGNSFVRYVSAALGFKPLTTAEYVTNAAGFNALTGASTMDNVRFAANPGAALTGAPTSINSLVLDGSGITLSGPASVLQINSGALLSAQAGANVIDTFTGITTAAVPYYIYVTNPSGQLTLNSPLTTAQPLVMAGAGTLILGNAGNTFTDLYFNQGVVQSDDLGKLGSGSLNFFGGTLQFGAVFDPSSKTVNIGTGGATMDTNTFDITLAGSIGGGGVGGLVKTGLGSLTLAASATFSGDTVVQQGSLILNGGANNRLPAGADLTIGGGTTSGILQLGDAVNGASDQTVAALSSSGSGTANAIVGGGAATSTLTVSQNTTTTYAGSLGGAGLNENNLGITKSGIGSLTLSGTILSYTGATTVTGGTLNITGSTSTPLATSAVTVAAAATLNFINGVGQTINPVTLNLGGGAGTAVLGLELGSTSAYDSIQASGAATTSGSVLFNLAGLSGFGAGTYDLLTAASGLSGATYNMGSISGAVAGFTLSLSAGDTFVRLNSAASTGDYYWQGDVNNSWLGYSGLNTNFTTDFAGTVNANGTPGIASSVIFSTSTQTGTALPTTLDGAFSIQDLTFSNAVGTGPLALITIDPGTGGTLKITPLLSSAGINVQTGAPASITLTAPVTLGADQTWTVADAGTVLSSSGGITGTANFIKDGAGTLILSGTNAYVGTTTVNGGILQSGGTNGFNQTSAHIINAGGTLQLNNTTVTIGSLAGSGTVENAGASGKVLTTGGDNTSTEFSGILQNGAVGALGLTKVGTGTMTLSGSASTLTGGISVNGGALAITGTLNNGVGTTSVGSSAATQGLLYVPSGGSFSTTTLSVGNNATGVGSLVINGGSVATTTLSSSSGISVGTAGYGALIVSGGSFSTNRISLYNSATGTGVFQISSGTVTASEYIIISNLHSEFTVTGGMVNHSGASQNLALGYNLAGTSVMNMMGGTVDNTGKSISFGQSTGTPTAFLNLDGGTLITNNITVTNTPVAVINFNGGTLQASAASTTFIPASSRLNAYVYSGGAVFDSSGNNITVVTPLLAPSGSGVSSLSLDAVGSGYIGAPYVEITGGGGTGATGYAVVDLDPASATYGQIKSIVLSNPGVGYSSSPTINLIGGGGTGAAVSASGIAVNASGGLVKNGGGILTLSGANTYTGGTTINAGTLALGANGVLADTGSVTINGGTLDINTRTETVGVVSLQGGGSITGSTGVLTSTADYDLQNGSVSGILSGSVGATKTTAGTVTLSSANTFTGPVNVNGGTLAFSAANNLGNAGAANTIGISGGTLSYTGVTALDLGANRVVTFGGSGATLDAASSTGVLTISGGVNAAGTGNLIKTGPGTVILSGTSSWNGGASSVTVTGGILQAGFGTSGISALTISASGYMDFTNGAAQVLTLGSTAGALTLNGGARLAFELGAPTVSDEIIVGSLGSALTTSGVITLDFLNLGGLAAGTYDLLSDPSGGGLLGSGVSYALGTAPSGFNYTINASNNLISLTVVPFVPTYWTNSQTGGSWATINAGPATNWSTNAAGTVNATVVPGASNTVIFSAANAPGGAMSTTLDGNYTLEGLQFITTPTSPATTAVSINQGTTGVLTLAPISTSGGIVVAANAGDETIAAPLVASSLNVSSQTWSVNGTGLSSLTITGNTTFDALVNKTGAGVLTLSGTNSGSGGLTLTGGTLNINSSTALGSGLFTISSGTTIDNTSGAAISLSTGNPQNWNGNFAFTGSNALNLGTGAVTMGGDVGILVSAGTLTVGGAIDDAASGFGLTMAGGGSLILNGGNTYDGLTDLVQGSLTLAGNNSGAAGGVTMEAATTLKLANAAALGTGVFTINGGTIDNTSGSPLVLTTNNLQTWGGDYSFTGTADLNLGIGAVTIGTNTQITTVSSTLTVGGVIGDAAEAFGITKTGTGTLSLGGINTYDGPTTLDQGTLIYTASQSQTSTTNTLVLGASAGSTSAVVLDLSGASAHFGGAMTVQTKNTTTPDSIIIGSGQTLQVDGNLTVGYSAGAVTTTKLNITGASGTFQIGSASTPTNGNVQIGGNSTSNFSNAATLDMSGLGTFYANLGNGTFRVGDATNSGGSPGSGGAGSTLILAPTSTIIATSIISDSPDDNVNQAIKLGSGVNEFDAATITIGISSNRGDGSLDFYAGSGSLVVRGLDGIARATMSVATGTSTSGAVGNATVDLTGHSADLLLGTLTIGGKAPTSGTVTGGGNGIFKFDTGILDATTVVVGTRTGAFLSTGFATGELDLMQNGGTGVVNISTLNMAVNSGSHAATNGQAKATLNIGGAGTVTITTLTMVSNSIGGGATNQTNAPADSTVNISGSATTVSTLNMNTNSSANTGSGNASLSTLNISGGLLTVGTGSGTALNMANASNAAATATSAVVITGGELSMNGSLAYTNGSGTANTTLTLNGGKLDMGGFSIGTFAQPVGSGTGSLNFQSGTLANLGELNGGGDLIKTTPGTLVLEGANTYTGKTVVNGGALSISSEANLGANPGATAADQLTLDGGTLRTTATLTIDDSNRGITVGPSGGAFETAPGTTATVSNVIAGGGAIAKEGAGTLLFTAVNTNTGLLTVNAGVVGGTGTLGGGLDVSSGGTVAPGIAAEGQLTVSGNLTVSAGGTLLMQLGGATTNDAVDVRAQMDSSSSLSGLVGSVPAAWSNYVVGTTLHDNILVNGASAPSIDGTLKIDPAFLNGYTPAYGDVFKLLDWTTAGDITGTTTFDYSGITLSPGLSFNSDLFASDGIIVIVPEPSRILLLMLGLSGLMLRRRRTVA